MADLSTTPTRKIVLFHDGCNICEGISAVMTATFAGPLNEFESVNLAMDRERGAEAQSLGITRLPSLVIDGRVLRLEDHSPIELYL